MSTSPGTDIAFAQRTLLELLRLSGPSGKEGAVAARIAEILTAECGVNPAWISHDDAHTRLPGYEIGNLIVRVPGTRPGPGRLFSTHMDTVPLCAGAVPTVDGGRIVPSGDTALGGDDRTGCAALVSMLHTLRARATPHPSLVVLFTVGEEAGLLGAREAAPEVFAGIDMGFNVDGGAAAAMVRGAIGMQVWRAEVQGRSSHAGVYPGRGISAIAIAALAIAEVVGEGGFGAVRNTRGRGTSNVGIIQGGHATNEVTRQVVVVGESRSHDPVFLDAITSAYARAFERAADRVRTADGERGTVDFRVRDALPGFAIPEDSPPAVHACRAARAIGLSPTLEICDGGLDANYLSRHVPTVTFGAGQHDPHSLGEYIDLAEFRDGCRLAVALATS